MPVVKTEIIHNDKFGASGSIALTPVDLPYINNTYTYQWSTGSTNATINNLPKGDYTVTITNATGGMPCQCNPCLIIEPMLMIQQ